MTNLGWECPKCGNCYSPSTVQCFICEAKKVSNIDAATLPYTTRTIRYNASEPCRCTSGALIMNGFCTTCGNLYKKTDTTIPTAGW